MKIVAVSDLHLDQSTAGVDRFDDVQAVLDQAVEYALDHKAAAFIFNGDLCDPNTARSHRALAALAACQRDLFMNGVMPVFLAGNHDVIEDGTGGCVLDVLGRFDMGLVFTRPDYMFDLKARNNRRICSLVALPFTPSSHNYSPAKFIEDLPANLEPPVLVIGHLNIEGISVGSETTEMPRGRDVFWPLAELNRKYPNALLLGGHYHTPQLFKGVHIIGSSARLRFDEKDNDPGFLVLEV